MFLIKKTTVTTLMVTVCRIDSARCVENATVCVDRKFRQVMTIFLSP